MAAEAGWPGLAAGRVQHGGICDLAGPARSACRESGMMTFAWTWDGLSLAGSAQSHHQCARRVQRRLDGSSRQCGRGDPL